VVSGWYRETRIGPIPPQYHLDTTVDTTVDTLYLYHGHFFTIPLSIPQACGIEVVSAVVSKCFGRLEINWYRAWYRAWYLLWVSILVSILVSAWSHYIVYMNKAIQETLYCLYLMFTFVTSLSIAWWTKARQPLSTCLLLPVRLGCSARLPARSSSLATYEPPDHPYLVLASRLLCCSFTPGAVNLTHRAV